MPVIRFACMNRCVAAAEEAARVALASGVLRESLTPKVRGARLAWPKRALVEASPATHS